MMGYFSNGTEWQLYEEQFCTGCVNETYDGTDFGCPIANLHFDRVGEENYEAILNYLIPVKPWEYKGYKGFYNCKCIWHQRYLDINDATALNLPLFGWEFLYDPPQDTVGDLELWQEVG